MFALCFVFLNSPWEASLLCLEHGTLLPSSPPDNSSRAKMMPRADCPGGFRIQCPEAEKALGWDSWKPGPSGEPGAHQHLRLHPAPGAAVQRPAGRGQPSSWLDFPLPVSRVFGFKNASPNDHMPFSLTASIPCYCRCHAAWSSLPIFQHLTWLLFETRVQFPSCSFLRH